MSRISDLGCAMLKMHREGLKWREIADRYAITPGMAWRIANQGYEPKSKAIRAKLGLGRRKKQALADLPADVLLEMLEKREPVEQA